MEVLYYISDCMIPFVILYLVGYGMCKKVDIFDSFIEGAKDGFLTVYKILPTLIGLMIGVGICGSPVLLEWLAGYVCLRVCKYPSFPGRTASAFYRKMFSSSAATGLLLDIYKTYGTDSYLGTLASVLMSCSETIFYTMSVYFMTARVTKNALYTYRSIGGNFCRGDGGSFAGGNVVKKSLLLQHFPVIIRYISTGYMIDGRENKSKESDFYEK